MLSIVIVNYNAGELLEYCINSIYKETISISFKVFVVDNNSHDSSVSIIKQRFPWVRLIENRQNLGFAKANNQAIRKCTSNYILLLNPDTLILDNAIEKMVRFMDEHPEVGISGCKIMNEDGTLQRACRRSIPTPSVAFFRLTGLSKLFPHSKTMAKYNLTYLDPNKTHEVDAVSGAFLLIRRKVIDDIGLLDERYFMYGEDLDWCLRAKNAGWKVVYCPDAEIIHLKGQCGKRNTMKAGFEFYRSMYLFHKKHFADKCNCFVNLIVYAGILLKALTTLPIMFLSRRAGSRG